jgi:hypothetical protein
MNLLMLSSEEADEGSLAATVPLRDDFRLFREKLTRFARTASALQVVAGQ